jgi:hypothetical protein
LPRRAKADWRGPIVKKILARGTRGSREGKYTYIWWTMYIFCYIVLTACITAFCTPSRNFEYLNISFFLKKEARKIQLHSLFFGLDQ